MNNFLLFESFLGRTRAFGHDRMELKIKPSVEHHNTELKVAQVNSEVAREIAELKRYETEKVRKQKEEVLIEVTLAKIKAAKLEVELANLELQQVQNLANVSK